MGGDEVACPEPWSCTGDLIALPVAVAEAIHTLS